MHICFYPFLRIHFFFLIFIPYLYYTPHNDPLRAASHVKRPPSLPMADHHQECDAAAAEPPSGLAPAASVLSFGFVSKADSRMVLPGSKGDREHGFTFAAYDYIPLPGSHYSEASGGNKNKHRRSLCVCSFSRARDLTRDP